MANKIQSLLYSRSQRTDISLKYLRKTKNRSNGLYVSNALSQGYTEDCPMVGMLNDFRPALKEPIDPPGDDGKYVCTLETKREWECKKKYMVRSGPTDEEQYRELAERARLMNEVTALLKEKKIPTNGYKTKGIVIEVKEYRPPTPTPLKVIKESENRSPTPKLQNIESEKTTADDTTGGNCDVIDILDADDNIELVNIEDFETTVLHDDRPKKILAWDDVTDTNFEQTTTAVPRKTKSTKVTSISSLDLDLPLEQKEKKKGLLRRLRDTIVKKSRNARYRFNAVMTRLKKGPPYMIIYVRYCWIEPIP